MLLELFVSKLNLLNPTILDTVLILFFCSYHQVMETPPSLSKPQFCVFLLVSLGNGCIRFGFFFNIL